MKKNLIIIVSFWCILSTKLIFAQGVIKDDFLVNDDAGNTDQFNPSISMDAVGNFAIVWFDFRNDNWDIYYQRYNNAGTALGVNTKANDDTESASQEHPSIAMDVTGNFVIAWDDNRNNNYDIYFQRYTSTGGALGVNIKVNDDPGSVKQWDPSISMDAAGNFVVVWIDERNGNRDIYFQRYTSTGGALGVNTKVNDDSGNADQISPVILIDAAGNFVIVWHDFRNGNWDIYFQRYTSTGTPLGINTKVNDDAGGEFQMYPSISMDAAGNFVVGWQDYRNTNWDIYFQRFTSTGSALGANTRVNDDTDSMDQKLPSISTDGTGNFVVVWQDNRQDQYNVDIYAQRYFSNGNPNGANYPVVADGPNEGESSPVVIVNNSNINFSWQDNRRSEGWDIYAKIVNWNWNGVTDIKIIDDDVPEEFSLSQNYPNPFNPSTKIKFTIPHSPLLGGDGRGGLVTLKIYDLLGNEITTLVNKELPAGEYEVEFNSHSGEVRNLSSGIYFYQLKTGKFIQTKKMILMK